MGGQSLRRIKVDSHSAFPPCWVCDLHSICALWIIDWPLASRCVGVCVCVCANILLVNSTVGFFYFFPPLALFFWWTRSVRCEGESGTRSGTFTSHMQSQTSTHIKTPTTNRFVVVFVAGCVNIKIGTLIVILESISLIQNQPSPLKIWVFLAFIDSRSLCLVSVSLEHLHNVCTHLTKKPQKHH